MPLLLSENPNTSLYGFLKIKYVGVLYLVVINGVILISDFQKER